jgi:transcriptional coactivator HFI1/ADA1
MPDLSLDPSALTVIAPPPLTPLVSKANGVSSQSAQKAAKPVSTAPRVDLEPLYTSLKASIGEFWAEYKEAIGLFVIGILPQAENHGLLLI